jgi:hypothetical protein
LIKGKQGIDLDFPAAGTRGKLYVEAKVRKKNSNTHEVVLQRLEKQFRRHLNLKISKQLTDTGEFVGGRIPVLHYEVGGSFFSQPFRDKMLERFQKILNKEFSTLKAAGFKFEDSNIGYMGIDDVME